MADLLSTQAGRDLLYRVSCYLGHRRAARSLKRSFFIAYDKWKNTGAFNLSTMLGGLNPIAQDEIESLGNLLGQIGCTADGATVAPMTVYVDDAGSDISGDGSASNPYASLAFMMSSTFPRVINHPVRVLISGNADGGELVLDLSFGPNGSLSVMGVGTPLPVVTSQGIGPFEITADIDHHSPITAVQLTFAENFAADELWGSFLRVEDGPSENLAVSIHKNTTNDIWVRNAFGTPPSTGEHVTIVRPRYTVAFESITINAHGPKYATPTDEASRITFANLNLDFTSSVNAQDKFVIRSDVGVGLSMVRIVSNVNQNRILDIDADVNLMKNQDTGAAVEAASLIENIDYAMGGPTNPGILVHGTTSTNYTKTDLSIRGGNVVGVDVRRNAYLSGTFGTLWRSAIGPVHVIDSGGGICNQVFFSGRPAAGSSVDMSLAATVRISASFFTGGLTLASVSSGTLIMTVCAGLLASFTGFGVEMLGSSHVVFGDDPTAGNMGGGAGDISFPDATGIVSFPAISTAEADTVGNVVAYLP